jgi:poly(A) polymerase
MEEHPQARFIVETLAKAGFIAYYAGGWVRDLLLQHPSDDIDIATNAPPETIQALFSHTVPLGIAFGIVLVIIEGHQYEVATFRQDLDYQDGRRPSRIRFTTAIEDARRRDFTINGMFYDPLKGEVLDYVNGRADLEAKIIRAIGNPHERIKEDRLRMLRAARLACRFGFTIEEETKKAILSHANELFPAVAVERIWQEFTKAYANGRLREMLILLHEFGLLSTIFPSLQTASLEEIKKQLSPTQYYPSTTPAIAFILPLFKDSPLSNLLELCKKLKLSNIDQQFVSFLEKAKELILQKKEVEMADWAHFYASELASKTLQIIGAHLPCPMQAEFAKEHEQRMAFLKPSIQRIQEQNPLVKSEDLLKEGIKPGVTMGILLKEANRLAINEQFHSTKACIERLKKHPIWPK